MHERPVDDMDQRLEQARAEDLAERDESPLGGKKARVGPVGVDTRGI